MKLFKDENLPLKYYFGVYQTIKGFPTNEDIMFELIQNKGIAKGGKFNFENVNKALSFEINEDQFIDFINFYEKDNIIMKQENFYQIQTNIFNS